VRRVLDVMRGRSFEESIMMLEYMPYRACEDILRTLKSVSITTDTGTQGILGVAVTQWWLLSLGKWWCCLSATVGRD
jgi:hypothetical protein